MKIPYQQIFAAGLLGSLKHKKGDEISSGQILDYCHEKCVDDDLNQHCTAPFLVKKGTCYKFEWSTEGALSHTTLEVRDAKSSDIVFYKDINGNWDAPEKTELVYVDFKPKTPGTCDTKIDYKIQLC